MLSGCARHIQKVVRLTGEISPCQYSTFWHVILGDGLLFDRAIHMGKKRCGMKSMWLSAILF